jgi:hypothetical protein
MKFSINYNGSVPLRDRIVKEMMAELKVHGHVLTSLSNELNFIINLTTPDIRHLAFSTSGKNG